MLSRNKVVLTEVGAGVKSIIFLAFFNNTLFDYMVISIIKKYRFIITFNKNSNPSLIGRVVVFEIIGIGSNPMGYIFLLKNLCY
jgi:hypothetical protein